MKSKLKTMVVITLMLMTQTTLMFAQQTSISGIVKDKNDGQPMIGVVVAIKGSTIGTTTDDQGHYALQNLPSDATLVFSMIGYQKQELKVAGQSVINISLASDDALLDEVVVIGYGTVKKSDLTGSVSSISSKQFEEQPITNIQEAMQGRMAGVEVSSVAGVPGGALKIRVRGTNSVNKSNDPIYVVDGVVRETGLDGFNPADIASIEVLKDASSTAIYGSRGANGVVLVTTRKGKEGKAQITLETDFGFSNISKKYDLLSPYDYGTMVNQLVGTGAISNTDLEAYKSGSKGINWQDQITQTGVTQNYKLSITGGNETTKYFISGSVLDQTGISVFSKYNRYQVRANLDTKVNDWFQIVADLGGFRTTAHNVNQFSSGPANVFYAALTYSPTMEMMDADGNYNTDPYNSVTRRNPYGFLKENAIDNLNYSFNGNIDFRFKLAKGLNLSVQGGLNYGDNKYYSFVTKKVETSNSMGNSNDLSVTWQNTNNLTYQNKWGDHSLTAMGVFELSGSQYRGMGISGTNLATEGVGYWNVNMAGTRSNSNYITESSLVSGIGRVMYNYKGRYLLTGTLRADGSSKFQGNNKWGYFPSGAIAWNMAEENFMKNQNVFQQVKLRASAGVTGNQAIEPYSTMGLMSSTLYAYGTENQYTGYWSDAFPTPDLTWEKTYQYDLGVDFSILDQRLNFTLDWYLKKTKDLLLQKTIPGYNGGGTYWVNQGEVKNSGFEFSVTAYPLDSKSITWETSLNASYLKNEITNLAGDPYILGTTPAPGLLGISTILMPGQPIGSFFLYNWEGIDEATGDNKYGQGNTEYAGLGNKVIKGKATPDWTFGWNNTFTWKNWEMNVFMNAAIGLSRLNVTKAAIASRSGENRLITLHDAYFQGWDYVTNKADAKYPSLTSSSNVNYTESTRWLEKADYLKLKNLSLAYRLPKSITKFADIKLSISCQNLFVITGYTGLDPESTSNVGNADSMNGIDLGAYPTPRTFSFGVKLDF